MEPGIKYIEGIVRYSDGMFILETDGNSRDLNDSLLIWHIHHWDLETIKSAIEYSKKDANIFDDPEEGDLQYLIELAKVNNASELIELFSGFMVTGNIYEANRTN